MSRIGSLLMALSKDWLRNREAAFFALLFPIILLAIFGTIFRRWRRHRFQRLCSEQRYR